MKNRMETDNRTCPNCGAPLVGFECPYCGATFYDFANLSMDKPVYLRYRHTNGKVLLMKTYLTNMCLDVNSLQDEVVHLDFDVFSMRQQPLATVSADFIVKEG